MKPEGSSNLIAGRALLQPALSVAPPSWVSGMTWILWGSAATRSARSAFSSGETPFTCINDLLHVIASKFIKVSHLDSKFE